MPALFSKESGWTDKDFEGWFGSIIMGWFVLMVMCIPTAVAMLLDYYKVIHSSTFDVLCIVIMGVGAITWLTMIVRYFVQDKRNGTDWLGMPVCVWYAVLYPCGVILGGGGLALAFMFIKEIIRMTIVIVMLILGLQPPEILRP